MDAVGDDSESRRAYMQLDAHPSSVAQARSFVTEMVRLWGCDDPMQIAGLLTSEVVTNAVRHAAETVGVSVALDEGSVLSVQTSDNLPDPPIVKPSSPDADSGRGMFLVERLARRWGVEPMDDGKIVWFEIRVEGCSDDPAAGDESTAREESAEGVAEG